MFVFPNSPKDPDEVEFFALDFTSRLATGETIASATSEIVVLKGVDAGAGSMCSTIVITAGVVKVKVSAGLDGNVYLITLAAVTSTGQTLELAGHLFVEELE